MAPFSSALWVFTLVLGCGLVVGAPTCNPGLLVASKGWVCLPAGAFPQNSRFLQTPVRFVGKHPECASKAGTKECWKDPAVPCAQKLKLLAAKPKAYTSISCGPQNTKLFGSDGYTAVGSFCAAAVAFFNPLGGAVLKPVGTATVRYYEEHTICQFGDTGPVCDTSVSVDKTTKRAPTACESNLELVASGDISLLTPRRGTGSLLPANCKGEFRTIKCPILGNKCSVENNTPVNLDPPAEKLSANGLAATATASQAATAVVFDLFFQDYTWTLGLSKSKKTVIYTEVQNIVEQVDDGGSGTYRTTTTIEYKVASGCLLGLGTAPRCPKGTVPKVWGKPLGCKKA